MLNVLLILCSAILCRCTINSGCSLDDADLHLNHTSQGKVIYNDSIPDEDCIWQLPAPTTRSALLLHLLDIDMTDGEDICTGHLYYPQMTAGCRKLQFPTCIIYTTQSSECTAGHIKNMLLAVDDGAGVECRQFALQAGGEKPNIMKLTTNAGITALRRIDVEYVHYGCLEPIPDETTTGGQSNATELVSTQMPTTSESAGTTAPNEDKATTEGQLRVTTLVTTQMPDGPTSESAETTTPKIGGTSESYRPTAEPTNVAGYVAGIIVLSILLSLCMLFFAFWCFCRTRSKKVNITTVPDENPDEATPGDQLDLEGEQPMVSPEA